MQAKLWLALFFRTWESEYFLGPFNTSLFGIFFGCFSIMVFLVLSYVAVITNLC